MMRRATAVLTAIAVVFFGITARLFWLANGELQTASEAQSTRRQTLAVARGTIYDRFLRPLVNGSVEHTALVMPNTASVSLMETALSNPYRHRVCETLTRGDCAKVRLDAWLPPCKGVTQVKAPIRYGDEALARHVIGYTDDQNMGVTGVESVFEEVLHSFTGKAEVVYAVDALGRVNADGEQYLENTLPRANGGIVLTLDEDVQRVVQTEAVQYLERGAVLVTDAVSGEILASVSLPLYDQNAVETSLADASSPLLDRTRIDYNCGSVFKILVAAAALEQGISADTTFTCNGYTEVDGVRFYCHNKLGDGVLTMEQAMAVSCNCYFIELALAVGADVIYEMALRAGAAQSVILLDGMQTAGGVLPSRRDLSADAALANLSIGQGDLLLTPYHVSMLMQAVANDGVVSAPSLFYGIVDENGMVTRAPNETRSTRLFGSKTARQLTQMLKSVVENGTGVRATPAQYSAAGKTGTAETGWIVDGEEVVQSWFTGVYPAEHPQYIVTVLSENGGENGKPAAPLFARIADGLFEAGLCTN